MTRRAALILVLVFLSAPTLSAQPPIDLDAAVAQIHKSGCREGLEALTAPAAWNDLEAQRASYLAGWCLARGGRYREAAEAYRGATGHPTLGMRAAIEEGLATIRAGSAANATSILRAAAGRTSGKLRGRALTALGQAELNQRNPSGAADALAAAVALRPSDPNAWLLLGDAAAAAGRQSVALRALALAAWAFPGEPAEGPARAALARLRQPVLTARNVPAARTVPAEIRMRQGRRFTSRGVSERAAAEFIGVIAARSSGRLAAAAWYQLAEIWMQDDLPASLAAFKRATSLGWDAVIAYQRIASIARRLGLEAEEREANDALMRTGPGVWAARTWVAAGLRAEKIGRPGAASNLYRRAIAASPPSHEAAEARWRLGWIALRGRRHDEAEARYREAAQAAPSRGEAARAWYWVAKAMATRGAAGADAVLRMVATDYPLTFYGQRARLRLNLPAPTLDPTPPRALPRDSAGPVYEELARLGLDADAADAGEEAQGARQDLDLVRFLAEAYDRLGAHTQAVAYAEQALASGMRDETMWRLAYPKAYWSEITAAADAANIDPLLLLALVREESRYDPTAVSPARAIGLAQILPSTARGMTRDRSLTVQTLMDPATNLRLGARYLSLQLSRFGHDPRLALAAYNAGPGSARKWAGSDPDPDYFIEKLGIAETRAYVRRVLGSYGIYKLLW